MALSSQAAPAFLRLAAHPVRWRLLAGLAGSDLRVRELTALVDQPQNLVSYHLRLLRDGGLVTSRRSTFDGRDSYYHLNLDGCALALARSGADLHPALSYVPVPAESPERLGSVAVLFACTGNSARSAIAEALLRRRLGGHLHVISAGSRPKPQMHNNTLRVLREEFDIDIRGQHPRHLDTVTGQRYDYVITLCDKVREVCPEFAEQPHRIHWSVPDPAAASGDDESTYPEFARVAADIDIRVRHLIPVLATHRSSH